MATIQEFAAQATQQTVEALFDDFRTVVITIVGFYFGSEAIISVAKILGVDDTASDRKPSEADRDLAPRPPSTT